MSFHGPAPRRRAARVVIIDDWELVRLGTSAVLRDQWLQPVAVTAGLEPGLGALRAHQPELVVLGRCAGVTPAALVRRALEASPASTVVVLAEGDTGDHRDVVAAGAAAVARRDGSAADLAALVALVVLPDRGDRAAAGAQREAGRERAEVLVFGAAPVDQRSV